ncbi:MAG: hypothetical protein ACRDXF_03725, partial [Acidimicrobiia bacterium]
MAEFTGRRRRRMAASARAPHLSFGAWDQLPAASPSVIQVCHPDWRGVRTVAYGFATPVVECEDLSHWGPELVESIAASGVELVVIQGWPPGAGRFVGLLGRVGVRSACVLHSSPAQHGAEGGEAMVVDEVLALLDGGALARVGMAKDGVHEAFAALGYKIAYVPNRVPVLPDFEKIDLGPGLNVGVFAEPLWRKNVTTQLMAVAMLEGARGHVMRRPSVDYLNGLDVEEHGELPWDRFIAVQSSVDLNLYVTLSECHPSTPQESYLAGVPCLVSRVSSVFRDDPVLWDLTSVDEADNPSSIANGARRLLEAK